VSHRSPLQSFLDGSVGWQIPRTKGAFSTYPPSSHPGEEHPGPRVPLAPWGSKGLGAGPAAAAWGPREERIKGSHVGPAFISRLQRGANKPCPCARRWWRQQLPPHGPNLLFPIFSSFPESQQGLLGRNGEFCQAGTCIWSHCTPDLELGAHTPCQSLPV
jgi:hypothetical protein